MTDLSDLSSLASIADMDLPSANQEVRQHALERQSQLTKPPGSLGRLEDFAVFLAEWQNRERPTLGNAQAIVFAGNHGICAQGVNPFPQAVTELMVSNFEAGGAAINQLCEVAGAALTVVPLELERPTSDFSEAEAMSEAECIEAIQKGAASVDPTADILILGEMGIGNSTVSAALAHAVFGGTAKDWIGRGTGSDEEGLALKETVVAKAIARHEGRAPIEYLAVLGGREQAAICGAVLAARMHRIPVVLDGYICTAAVAPLYGARQDSLDHCLVAHKSAEPGHVKLCASINKKPILDLGMALGEGTGAALALNVLRGAVACHNGMATFAEAGIG